MWLMIPLTIGPTQNEPARVKAEAYRGLIPGLTTVRVDSGRVDIAELPEETIGLLESAQAWTHCERELMSEQVSRGSVTGRLVRYTAGVPAASLPICMYGSAA
jgi:hypothetical protein